MKIRKYFIKKFIRFKFKLLEFKLLMTNIKIIADNITSPYDRPGNYWCTDYDRQAENIRRKMEVIKKKHKYKLIGR